MLKHLLSGSSLSSVAVFAAKDSGTSEAQGMNTNVTHALHQNPDTILNNIRQLSDIHQKAGVRLVCGITQFMIVRTYHFDDNQRWQIDRSKEYLATQLNESGLKRAMSYRYIQTAQKLAQVFLKKYGLGGMVHDVLSAVNEGKAFETILKATHGLAFLPDPSKPVKAWAVDAEQKPRLSMDVLRVNLGLEQLDETKQPGYKPPAAAPVDANNPAAALTPVTPTVPATKAKPESIIARLKADKDMVKRIPSEIIMGAAVAIGREQMAERLVSLMSLEECTKLQTAIIARMQTLANPKADKPADTPAETPAPEAPKEGEAIEQEQTRTRSRSRSRKAA